MSAEWLDELEAKVHAATNALQALRNENRRLTRELEKAQSSLKEVANERDSGAALAEERDEIRRRVEALASGLETLLETPESA